jgi:folate-dependent phosphoribosylglycinamide formyltransferase PurN
MRERICGCRPWLSNHLVVPFANIVNIIPSLFPLLSGGRASLTLDNMDEPYLGGIRFTIMPPMKRHM